MNAVPIGGMASVGVVDRVGVVQKQRFSVPVEPQVRVLVLLVDPLVELLDDGDHLTVERPETELGRAVAFRAHLLHRGEKHLPFVPIAHGVGDVHHQHVHSCVGKHRHVLADHPLVLAQEIAHLRLSPVVGAIFPVRIVGLKPGVRVGLENLCDISLVRGRKGREVLRVPGYVEYSHDTALVGLHRTYGIYARHCPAQGVSGHPSVLVEVN